MRYTSVFHLVSDAFSENGAACVLIGGFAVNFYDVPRATEDVDFLTTKEKFEKAFGLIEKEGFRKFSEHETFVQLKNEKSYIRDLDFMFVDQDILDKIVKEGKDVTIAGRNFKIPSLFHLLALKLHAIKFNKKREYKDLIDIVDLVRNNKVDVRNEEFKTLCLKYGPESIYERILKHLS